MKIGRFVEENFAAGIAFAGFAIFIAARFMIAPLDYWDEAGYMKMGLTQLLPPYSPVFCLWYRFLTAIFVDPVVVFRVSHGLILFGTIVAFYKVLRVQKVEKLGAILASALLLCWLPWSTELVHVNHFDLLFVLFGYLVVRRLVATEDKIAVLGVFYLGLVYVRPDNVSIALGLFTVLVFFLIKNKSAGPLFTRAQKISAVGAVLLVTLFASYNPFGGRGWLTFQDHYFWGIRQYNVSERDLINKDFGEANSILEAIQANSSAFLSHISNNVTKTASRWSYYATSFEPYPFFLVSFAVLLIFLIARYYGTRNPSKKGEPDPILGILTLLFLARSLFLMLLFQPVFRYYAELWIIAALFLIPRIPFPLLHRKAYVTFAVLVGLSFSIAFRDPSVWAQEFKKDRWLFTELAEKLKSIPADRKESWFANHAYPLFNSMPKAEVEFPLSLLGHTQDEIEKWIGDIKKKKLSILIFDRMSKEGGERFLSREGYENLQAQLATSCYETWDQTQYATVYLRKKDCTTD